MRQRAHTESVPFRGIAHGGRCLAALLVLVTASCGEPPSDPDASPPESTAAEAAQPPVDPAERYEHLRALGYVADDPDTDPALTGVVLHDRARTAPGLNLYTNDADRVYLMDLDGRRVHEWRLPEGKRRCEYAEPMDAGRIAVVCLGRSVTVLDWDSNVVHEIRASAHHDVHALPDGSLVALFRNPRDYQGRRVDFDGVVTYGPDGKIREVWPLFPALEALRRLHAPSPLDTPLPASAPAEEQKNFDYYHLNSVEVLPDTPLGRRDPRFRAGNWLLCLRNANVLVVLDPQKQVTWSWGEGVLDLPHMPTMLPDGHILVFDNGTNRGHSRVLELDPEIEEIVWRYEAEPKEAFFSRWRGSNQRLANGNTLICEAERGRAFEVTPAGETIWEFWNPEMRDGQRRRLYRFLRYPRSRFPLLDP